MKIVVEKECVKPGDIQTVTITTKPGAVAGYNVLYPDGKSGGMKGYYGGNNGGEVDDEGRYTDSFTVGLGAPAGTARVDSRGARGTNELGEASTSFQIADAMGTCG